MLSALRPGQFLVRVLYLIAIGTGGFHVARRALYSLRSLTLDTNVLVIIAVLGAVIIGEWTEGAVVVLLFAISNTLESYSMERTRQSIRFLMDLAPREARVRRQGREVKLPLEEVRVGDLLIIHPGERIPLDGRVVKGRSSVNQAPITGESLPVAKGPGEGVFAGTLNQEGVLEVEVTRLVADTTLAQIIHQVAEAQARQAPGQHFIDRFAAYYTPLIIALAVLAVTVPPWILGQPFAPWFYRGLALLVVACPCALVISTPVTIVSAIGNAARHGVLIKGGIYLERVGNLKLVAFDKTGTLTWGRPQVKTVLPLGDITGGELLALAAGLERRSEHPLGTAVVRKARMEGISPADMEKWTAIPGKGIKAFFQGRPYYIGNARLFTELGLDLSGVEAEIARLQEKGETVVLVGNEKQVLGIIGLADEVRPGVREAIIGLRQAGIGHIAMLTGDSEGIARSLARELGVDLYWAQLLPQEKMELIEKLKGKYGPIAMVGDGINDAPALATATLGIAMGVAGTDSVLETADIALMADDLTKLPYIVRLSRATMRIIKQNIAFSLGIKLAAILLAIPNWLTLWLAVLADTGAALLVTLNGMRLMSMRP